MNKKHTKSRSLEKEEECLFPEMAFDDVGLDKNHQMFNSLTFIRIDNVITEKDQMSKQNKIL